MLTRDALVELKNSLRDRKVLSVYVNGDEPDPAKRRRWRVDLRNSLNEIETSLKDSSHIEREDFATCRRALLERFDATPAIYRTPGWAAFLTADGVFHAGQVPAGVPTIAAWSVGPCLTPYIKALKEVHPVIVVIADSRKTRIYKYVERNVSLLATLRAQTKIEHPSHMSAPPRPGFHSGTRGTAGADAAQRELHEGTAHLLRLAAEKCAEAAGDSAFVVVGGIPSVVSAFLRCMPQELAPRTTHADRLDVHATKADVALVARKAASHLRDLQDARSIDAIIMAAESNGHGAIGAFDVQRSLEQGSARDVYFTAGFMERHAAPAETIVRLALETNAHVEQVSREAAVKLDAHGGVVAALRYAAAVLEPAAATP